MGGRAASVPREAPRPEGASPIRFNIRIARHALGAQAMSTLYCCIHMCTCCITGGAPAILGNHVRSTNMSGAGPRMFAYVDMLPLSEQQDVCKKRIVERYYLGGGDVSAGNLTSKPWNVKLGC